MNESINQETGEINWDCPCLKSALEPPCGEFFKLAFECFVKSKAEPKGAECHEKFIAMQKCYSENEDKYNEGTDTKEASSPTTTHLFSSFASGYKSLVSASSPWIHYSSKVFQKLKLNTKSTVDCGEDLATQ